MNNPSKSNHKKVKSIINKKSILKRNWTVLKVQVYDIQTSLQCND